MPPWTQRRRGDSASNSGQQQHDQLPFTNDAAGESDFSQDQDTTEAPSNSTRLRGRPIRALSSASNSLLSSSYTQRTLARSFAHQVSSTPTDAPQYASYGVRERTQELASYALDPDHSPNRPSHGRSYATESDTAPTRRSGPSSYERDPKEARRSLDSQSTDTIVEDSEPESAGTVTPGSAADRHTSSEEHQQNETGSYSASMPQNRTPLPHVVIQDTENTPLLPKARLSRLDSSQYKQKQSILQESRGFKARIGQSIATGRGRLHELERSISNPKNYTREAVLGTAIRGFSTLSAVFLGLLLNILDALSYGYILFPLGSPLFSHTGPDGISIFFVSCIVSQLCYSLGLSVFRGGVGSEMIEVVPFFHKMTYSIMARMEGASQESIIATVIVAYCLSSIVTGLIFLGLGAFKLGNLVSFFPRHILIGCIGGVGFFLFVTGIEVSARLEGNLNYDLKTLKTLFSSDTVYLWMLPLGLCIILRILRTRINSPFVLPAFFISVFAIFYLVVKGILKLDLETVRNSGWIFEKPEAGVPFYRFYTYFKFGSVDGGALLSTIPTMFALSFFGVIHVPINVPALAAAVGEDDISVNRELIAHGISNTLSGLVGSIQNYLVYANSILFIENGGDSRLSGLLLAAATAGVWVAGPAMIGYIPVCLVGALIFLLGIDLLHEAVWDTFGKAHKLEYMTIIAIVLIMGVWDFVIGIFAGIVLACLNYVVQSSRTPAVRATYSGEVAESTVRRPRADRRYLSKVREQVRIIKLGGFLFFGTIVSVEEYVRSLIDDENFEKQPISFVILDFTHVPDVDFSSAEGFQRINRILNRKNVKMRLSGVSFATKVGQALQNVGLLDVEKGDNACPPPRVFEDLNTALEACENELLDAFYRHRIQPKRQDTPPMSISDSASHRKPFQRACESSDPSLRVDPFDPEWQSPRRGAQLRAARTTMNEAGDSAISDTDTAVPSKWKNFAQPIRIIMQSFQDVSNRNEDFWQVAAPYFQRMEYPAGQMLYSRGDEPNGFYILERGRFRAEYDLDQGRYYEVILPGTTCGELPFFSETDRTGTVLAENDSVAWLLTRDKFKDLERRDGEVGKELLKVGLKLTKERMDAITSYVLITAS